MNIQENKLLYVFDIVLYALAANRIEVQLKIFQSTPQKLQKCIFIFASVMNYDNLLSINLYVISCFGNRRLNNCPCFENYLY